MVGERSWDIRPTERCSPTNPQRCTPGLGSSRRTRTVAGRFGDPRPQTSSPGPCMSATHRSAVSRQRNPMTIARGRAPPECRGHTNAIGVLSRRRWGSWRSGPSHDWDIGVGMRIGWPRWARSTSRNRGHGAAAASAFRARVRRLRDGSIALAWRRSASRVPTDIQSWERRNREAGSRRSLRCSRGGIDRSARAQSCRRTRGRRLP